MRRLLLTALVGLALAAAPSSAQMSAALGKPLPDASLEVGTVTVRVVDGSPKKPLPGLVVKLAAGEGAPLSARTNEQGRATFPKLSPGSQYRVEVEVPAKEPGEEPATLKGEPFAVPESGGIRFMLSAKPLAMPSAGAGPRGMPNPRNMSGIPRPDRQDPRGTLVVRGLQGALSNTESNAPEGATVYLVGYPSKGPVTVQKLTLADDGRVEFKGLKSDGSAVYYAMTQYKRGDKVDRLVSQPITLPPEIGVRLMLAGPDKSSNDAVADDLPKFEQFQAPPAGEVRVRLSGDIGQLEKLELVEIGNPKAIAEAPVMAPLPSPQQIQSRFLSPAAQVPGGTIDFSARRANRQPLANLKVTLKTVGEGAAVVKTMTTSPQGRVVFDGLDVSQKYEVEVDIFGKVTSSAAISISAEAGAAQILEADWQAQQGMREAIFRNVPSDGERVFLVRANIRGQYYRSSPFQTLPDRGAGLSMFLYPRVLFAFRGQMDLDDDNLWFHMRIDLANVNKEPIQVPANGLLIPLPDGFIAGEINEEMGSPSRVSVDPTNGVRWRGPLPPGQRFFVVTFALPTEDGKGVFDMPLPFGALQSSIAAVHLPGMVLDTPPGAKVSDQKAPNGKMMKMMNGISVNPGQRLVFGISGLPQRPAWHWWLRVCVGFMVIAIVLWGIAGLFRHRDVVASEEGKDQREALFDELVKLERSSGGKKAEKRKRAIRQELEALYEAEAQSSSTSQG